MRERAGADGFVEDEDAADDRGEVRGHGGEGDDFDGRPDLEAAGGGVERDHSRDERGERPWAQQPVQRSFGVGEVLDRDVGDAEQRPGGQPEQQSFGAAQDAPVRRDRHERGADREDRALDGDQRRQRRAAAVERLAAAEPDHHEPHGRDRDAEPLPSPEVKAEVALGDDGEEDKPRRKRTACTIDNGASASAPTCSAQARIATIPSDGEPPGAK